MTQKQAKKRTPMVFRSMKEFKEHYTPNAYEKEQQEKKRRDLEDLGATMAQDYLEKVKRELQRRN